MREGQAGQVSSRNLTLVQMETDQARPEWGVPKVALALARPRRFSLPARFSVPRFNTIEMPPRALLPADRNAALYPLPGPTLQGALVDA